MAARLRHGGRMLLDALLPPHCIACDAPVQAQGQLCMGCFAATIFVTDPCCARCGVPFAHAAQADAQGNCPACAATPPVFRIARGALRYEGTGRTLVLAFKHADRTELAAALAPMMARAGAKLLRQAQMIVPVPLHRHRLRQRRYNQAALLARALARRSLVPCCVDALQRIRPTQTLRGLGAADRQAALQGAFAVAPRRMAALAGRQVLLVDDVLTSGATANGCARVLLAAGAAGVAVLVAARVADPRLE